MYEGRFMYMKGGGELGSATFYGTLTKYRMNGLLS